MYEQCGTLIKEIKNIPIEQVFDDGNQEIFIKNIFVGVFQYYDENRNIIIIDYIHSNLSETTTNPLYEISAFVNDFKIKIHTYGDFYSEILPPGKKVKNQLSFTLEEFGIFELHISFKNPEYFKEGIKKFLTIDINP